MLRMDYVEERPARPRQDRHRALPRRGFLRRSLRLSRRRAVLATLILAFILLVPSHPAPVIRFTRLQGTEPAGGAGGPSLVARMTSQQTAAYAAALRVEIEERRGPAITELKSRLEAEQRQRSGALMIALAVIPPVLGLALLVTPLVRMWRYPGAKRVFLGYSMIAALLFVAVAYVLVGFYGLTRLANIFLSMTLNPELSVTEGAFDFLITRSDALADVGPTILAPTFNALVGDPSLPAVRVILENAQRFSKAIDAFTTLARVARVAAALLSLLPLGFLLLAFFMFVKNAMPTLMEIVRMPARAARDEKRVGRSVARNTVRSVWREGLYALGLIGLLLALTVVVASVGRGAIEPAIAAIFNYVLASLIYVQVEAGAQPFWILFGTVMAMMLLLLSVGTTASAALLLLWKSSSVARAVVTGRAPFKKQKRFWLLGLPGVGWVMLLPILFVQLAGALIGSLGQASVDAGNWLMLFGIMPVAMLVLYAIVFWAAYGLRSIRYVVAYKPIE